MTVLEAHRLTFGYSPERTVLHDVDLRLDAGEVVGLIGPNGSGKSTLIRLLADLLHTRHGDIRVCGLDHRSRGAKTALMHLASNDYLPEFLTGLEYLRFMHSLYDEPLDVAAAETAFDRYQMTGRHQDLIEDYSHGMRKKTQLIAALLLRRPLTLIDETLNGIDIDATYTFERDIAELRMDGHGVLLCSHDFALLERCADRVVFLHHGVVLEDAPTPDLCTRHGNLDLMVREAVDATRVTS